MLKTFAAFAMLNGVLAGSDPYEFKCNPDIEGGHTCRNEGLGASLRVVGTDLAAISATARPFDI